MSLRFRLNLLVTLLSLAILILGAWLVIHNARRAVSEEIQSTASLALQLLEVAIAAPDGALAPDSRARLLGRLEGLDQIRHLDITLTNGDGDTPLGGARPRTVQRGSAPAWFVSLVEPAAMEFRRPLAASPEIAYAGSAPGPGSAGAEIVIRADPADEIEESWVDARNLLGLVVGFTVIANAAFFVAVGYWLRPLGRVLGALEGIERGDYSARLPPFSLPELAALAGKFNHMASVLERSRDENRELTQRSLAIQETERRHLARELHDELGQSVSAIKAVAVSIGQDRDGRRADVASAAATIAEIATHMYSTVAGIIRRLRPGRLDEFGLVAAVEELVDGWNERHPDTFCSLTTRGDLEGLGENVDINVYRIIQESLTNVAKHANASQVTVTLERDIADGGACDAGGDGSRGRDLVRGAVRDIDGVRGVRDTPSDLDRHRQGAGLRLEIRDDGVGFDSDRTRRGLGLLGIRERIDVLQGTFQLHGAPGEGTSIRIELPVNGKVSA